MSRREEVAVILYSMPQQNATRTILFSFQGHQYHHHLGLKESIQQKTTLQEPLQIFHNSFSRTFHLFFGVLILVHEKKGGIYSMQDALYLLDEAEQALEDT
ncbi:hypothetical protein MKZ04_19995 [Bacillus sp. FSL W7-1354]|uniref:hypothetical protein n=1 Tax=Bacillus sp. FSL W7-1354 TaxID=2921597 RepID=UPI0030F95563